MKCLVSLLAIIALVQSAGFCQVPVYPESLRIQREKIETILRLQDSRSLSDGKLVAALSDVDPLVRKQGALAFASIQDTNVIHLLVDLLHDPDLSVQFHAALAIGQTAGALTTGRKEALEHDLIWRRLDLIAGSNPERAQTEDLLIEEIGKFGTLKALDDLVLRYGGSVSSPRGAALLMSIARFAIRGIVSSSGTGFVINVVKRGEGFPWSAVYALQRIGNRPEVLAEIEGLIPLWRHRNPMVRMHLATLLGKLRDEQSSMDPLRRLAESDPDWRVRVNAFRALSNFRIDRDPEIIDAYRRAFLDRDMNVRIASIKAFGESQARPDSMPEVRKTFSLLENMAVNKDDEFVWQIQAEAAEAIAKRDPSRAIRLITPADDDPHPKLTARQLIALGHAGRSGSLTVIQPFCQSENSEVAAAALEGLENLARNNPRSDTILQETFHESVRALDSEDLPRIGLAAGILGDSLFRRFEIVPPLVASLANLRPPDHTEAIQSIMDALKSIGDERAVPALERQLNQPDLQIRTRAAAALEAITGRSYMSQNLQWFEPLYADYDFAFLSALPDTVPMTLETIRGNIQVELYKNAAPFTVMSIIKLTRQRGFYRGLTFHRVVPNFVIQGGDPLGSGWGGPGYSIRSEFSMLRFERGSLGMASSGKDTEGCQFFITHSPQPHLDGRYTVFGKVLSGMEIVDAIQVDDHIFDFKEGR